MESNKDIIKTFQIGAATVTLVGTAHVSRQSVQLVEEQILSGQYDCVAVELCEFRLENLVNRAWWRNLDVYQIFRRKRASLLLINLALSAYQKRLADKVGVEAGREMTRAVELSREKNIRLEVIDRNITTTLHRLVTRVSFWRKLKVFSGLVAGIFVGDEVSEKQIEELKEGDMLQTVIEEFGESLPQFKEVLIDERDDYMIGALFRLARSPGAPKNILALVGAGHLIGMAPGFSNPPDDDRLRELDEKPPPSRIGHYIGWAICILILSMFYVGYSRSPELGLQLVITWVTVNGGLSALGAAIGLAHPLSILTAFLAAPLTSLNPAIGAGMVVGLVESYLRKPKVSDFEALREDIGSIKRWWKNRVVRVLMIFFLANTGSAVGTYVAGASIAARIFG